MNINNKYMMMAEEIILQDKNKRFQAYIATLLSNCSFVGLIGVYALIKKTLAT